jgi:Fe-S oxidoreductase
MNDQAVQLETKLDWSAYDSNSDFGFGDFSGGDFGDVSTETTARGYTKAVAMCMGKRQCQKKEQGVMCPSYRATDYVKHSTNHRASTLKAALNGEFGERPFLSKALIDAMELCVSCKGCKRECPHGVDMALLRVETLAQRWQQLGRVPLRERLFASLPRYARYLKYFNWALALRKRLPFLAKGIERWLGIAARRSLPRAASRDFISTQPRMAASNDGSKEVVLLVDTFSNYLDPQIAEAALAVLQAAGYTVHIAQPKTGERALCCGRTFLSNGLVEEARTEASRLLDALAPYTERGLPIIGLEPSCLLMLRDEYHALGLGERVRKISGAAFLLEEFMARELGAQRLKLPLKPLPLKVLVHGHCHQKAFGVMPAMEKVLSLVPELKVEFIESSCCGMAGSFGMETEHFEASMQMGELSLLPAVREATADTLLIANGTSCRHQIRDGVAREALHLAQVLRLALQHKP